MKLSFVVIPVLLAKSKRAAGSDSLCDGHFYIAEWRVMSTVIAALPDAFEVSACAHTRRFQKLPPQNSQFEQRYTDWIAPAHSLL